MSSGPVDVLIIGGGPAGTSAAITLARQGWRVTLIEAKPYPREMVCGEFLSPEGIPLLARLGIQADLDFAGAASIRKVRFVAPAGRDVWEADLPGVALGISRRALDERLAVQARQAGVVILEGRQAVDIQGGLQSGFTVLVRGRQAEENYPARVVIGAWGKRSALDRTLGRAFIQRPQPYVALKAHVAADPLGEWLEMHAFPGGYCGISDIEENQQNVCLLVRQPVFQQHGQTEDDPVHGFITWMKQQVPALNRRLEGAQLVYSRWMAIAQVPFEPKENILRDVLLAGDASGLIAPLAGDGISMALEAGWLAGDLSSRFLSGQWNAVELRREYMKEWRKRFAFRLALGRMLQPLLLEPASAEKIFRLLAASPALGQTIIRWTRGKLPQQVRAGSLG